MKKLKNVTPNYVLNPYRDQGISDEYYIDEIIGIPEIRYKDLIKDKPQVTNPIPFFKNK